MDLILDLIGMVAEAARRVWPGALLSALFGYIGWQWFGFLGFWAGAAIGALVGTWVGVSLGLVRISNTTGNPASDRMIAAAGAFAIVAVGYLLLQFIYILLAIAVVIAIASFWLSS